jgi:hypothetical protein
MAMGSFAYALEAQLVSATAKDYEGHWAQVTIQKWMDEGRVAGYPDGSYKPDSNVTRAEFVKLVNGIIDFNKKADVKYKDVPSTEWYYDYVSVAQEVGYISGYSADLFGPNDYITREQAASILSRIQYLSSNEAGAAKYDDNSKISSWAKGGVGAASEAGFISGYNDGSFKPLNNLTRAEALTMIDNVLVNSKNYVIYNNGTELKDFVVDGDLIIAKTVGDGDVHLTNVEVKGNIYVYGGGLNSLYFNNLKVAKIVVEKDKVRLVLGEGTNVQEIEVSSQAVLENSDGTIAKVTLTGDNAVTLTGEFDDVTVIGNSDIVLKDATVKTLVAENPIVIKGTGTIATLNANADGITFESEVEIKKSVTGEGVTEAPAPVSSGGGGGGAGGPGGGGPVYVPALRVSFIENTNTYRFSYSYEDTDDDLSEFLLFMLKETLSDDNNDDFINGYLGKVNSRLNDMYAGGTKVYSEEGWNKAVVYLDSTEIQDDIQGLKSALLDGTISAEDIVALIGIFEASSKSDANTIVDNLTANDINQRVMKYKGVDVNYSLKTKLSDTPVTSSLDIATFIIDNILYSDISVDAFLQQYGPVELTIQYGENTGKIIIDLNSIVK